MAGNILELQKHVFPGKKIIVWAANAHILHNSRADGIYPFRSMGDYLWAQLGDRCFTVLFTSSNGHTRNIYNKSVSNIFEAGNRSLEGKLKERGWAEGLVDLRRLPASAHFKLRVLRHGNHEAHWPEMADALHFIPQMTPYAPN